MAFKFLPLSTNLSNLRGKTFRDHLPFNALDFVERCNGRLLFIHEELDAFCHRLNGLEKNKLLSAFVTRLTKTIKKL